MAAFDYTQLVIDHFRNPRNMGKMEDADGIRDYRARDNGHEE